MFWVEAFTLQAGDRIRVLLRGPDGTNVAENIETLSRSLARKFNFVGRKRRGASWPAGMYEGQIEITRNGVAVIRTATATIE